MAIIGNPIVSTDFPKDTFSGNGSTTAFTMQIAPASVNSVIVVVSGITQDPSTYTISGTTLTFSAAPPTGTNNISVRHLGIAGIPNTPSAGSVVATSIADGVITAAKFASGQTPSFNGITFPASQSASADANTLDDYEEGTWTPSVNILYGITPSSPTYSGRYIKIGRMVYASFSLNFNSSQTVATGMRGRMLGLPFTSENIYTIDGFNGGGSAGNFYSWSGNQNTQVLVGVTGTEVFFNITVVNGSVTFGSNPITGMVVYTTAS